MTAMYAPNGLPESLAATRVLIAHPSGLFAEMLSATLAATESVDVLGTGSSAGEAIAGLDRLHPDVLILGAFRADELEAVVAAGKNQGDGVPILIVGDETDADGFVRAMNSGVSGFITTACSAAQLVDAVRRVADGEIVVLGVDARGLVRRRDDGGDVSPALSELTGREREILRLICEGRSNVQIARELFISQNTVRTHVQNIRAKLKVNSKLEAALVVVNGGAAKENGSTHHYSRQTGAGRTPADLLRPVAGRP